MSVPGPIVVEAAGPTGAPVVFLASAADLVDGVVALTCRLTTGFGLAMPIAPGAVFPIGDNLVTCTAIDRRLSETIRDRLASRPGAALVEHTAWPSNFACPNLVLRGEDGLNYGVSDVMSPWSAAVAEPGKEA